MTDKPTGGPAFPTNEMDWQDGMTLRDWFAGQALANPRTFPDERDFGTPAEIAQQAYAVADAMLAEREKGGGE